MKPEKQAGKRRPYKRRKNTSKRINIAPTWTSVVRPLVAMITGKHMLARRDAINQLYNMALAADRYNESVK